MEDSCLSRILTPEDLWAQACVLLAALYHSHTQTGSITTPVLAGVVPYDTMTVGLKSLHNTIIQLERIFITTDRRKTHTRSDTETGPDTETRPGTETAPEADANSS